MSTKQPIASWALGPAKMSVIPTSALPLERFSNVREKKKITLAPALLDLSNGTDANCTASRTAVPSTRGQNERKWA